MMFNVGLAYTVGTGVTVDERASFERYRRSAEAEYAGAQFNHAIPTFLGMALPATGA